MNVTSELQIISFHLFTCYILQVSYSVNADGGYVAEVSYEGTAVFPEVINFKWKNFEIYILLFGEHWCHSSRIDRLNIWNLKICKTRSMLWRNPNYFCFVSVDILPPQVKPYVPVQA